MIAFSLSNSVSLLLRPIGLYWAHLDNPE
jgi:hypothetical protein